MVNTENSNGVENQNTFSKISRTIFGRNIYYNYYKDNHKKRYSIGRFRYSIDGEIKISNVDKELSYSGIESDGKTYYWHYFHNSCSFEKNLNYNSLLELKNNRFIVNRVNAGKWNFNHNAYACITRAIAEIKSQLNSDQYLVVLFPNNKKIDKKAQKRYQSEFIELLKQDHVTYVVGDINKIQEEEKQLIIVVIDLVTTIQRKNNIIRDILNKKSEQKPLVTMYSLIIIFDEIVGQFCISLHILREKQEKEGKAFVSNTPIIDEETVIMRSLAGHGPDPEIFGF